MNGKCKYNNKNLLSIAVDLIGDSSPKMEICHCSSCETLINPPKISSLNLKIFVKLISQIFVFGFNSNRNIKSIAQLVLAISKISFGLRLWKATWEVVRIQQSGFCQFPASRKFPYDE
jgi:hypothetical protein